MPWLPFIFFFLVLGMYDPPRYARSSFPSAVTLALPAIGHVFFISLPAWRRTQSVQLREAHALARAALAALRAPPPTRAAAADAEVEAGAVAPHVVALRAVVAHVDLMLKIYVKAFAKSEEGKQNHRLRRTPPAPATLDSFSLYRRIGKGSYGEVWAARKEDTLALFALKVIKAPRVRRSAAGAAHLRAERWALEKVATHGTPFVVGLRYAFLSGDDWFVLALPLLTGGTLSVHIEERGQPKGLPQAEVRWIAANVTLGLEALHSLRILHRDVKPANVVYSRDGRAVLTDLGLSAALDGEQLPHSRTGTRGYWAPEVVRSEPQGEVADWWALGITIAYAACGGRSACTASDSKPTLCCCRHTFGSRGALVCSQRDIESSR